MLKIFKKNAFWYLALIAVIYLMGWGLKITAERMDYTWHWNRVPHYFLFTGLVDHYSSDEGVAHVDKIDDQKSKVTLEYKNGKKDVFTILSKTLLVKDGSPVTEVDKIGSEKVVSQGILVTGLITTLEISMYSAVLGMLIGILAGMGRISTNPLFKGLSTIYVEIIRGTPLLVQIFIFYFFFGTILELTRFTAGMLALAFFTGAYVAEIIRAGIQSIDPGQMEAARSLGMNYVQSMIHIIMPQALKRTLPPMAGQFISLIKDSSLVSVIAITDLTKAGREIITTSFYVFEIWTVVALMYLVLTFSLSMVVRYIERRFSVSD